jgi:cytochrome o ubiquinol oxidase subunit II
MSTPCLHRREQGKRRIRPAIVSSKSASIAALTPALLLAGCSGVLDPQGSVGQSERLILINSLVIMLAIVVPVILATVGFAWWFRASNTRAQYLPDWAFSGHLELIVWAIPALVITFLGGIAWFGSHTLDPFKPLPSQAKPLEVEVVSLDWKWLFIYPDDGVAAVNQLVIPVGAPVHFKLTSSGVMNSFFVPQLGSQIYTMAGMTSQLSLEADREGTYPGLSAQFSGAGFSGMRFDVRAVTADAYAKWVAQTKAAGGGTLDRAAYTELAKPSQNVKPATYRAVAPKLFDAILKQSTAAEPGSSGRAGGRDTPSPRTRG